ncbi:MAG: LysR family transcriptional regulator, partial [Rhizobacter sp.]|nr:LysR family transcriptional regulator [Rhizobacter sp.]
MASDELASGAVVEVMATLRPGPTPISAVLPSSPLLPPRVRVVLDALERVRERRPSALGR